MQELQVTQKEPTGTYLLNLLVKLLAEQENLAIEYEIVKE